MRVSLLVALIMLALSAVLGNAAGAEVATKTVPPLCAHAAALEGLGRLDEAEAAYLAALSEHTPPCASRSLALLAGGSSPCVYESFLRRLGQTDAAEEEYRRALIRDPALACAHRGLDWLRAEGTIAALRTHAATIATDAGELAIRALELIATLVVAWYVVLLVVGRTPVAKHLLKRFPPARRALGVQVIFEEFQDDAVTPKMGAGVIALMRGAMRRRLPQSEEELDQVTGQSSIAEGLAGLSALSPQLGTLAATWTAIERLLPRVRVNADGVLQPPFYPLGWGLSLAVRHNDEFSGTATLRSGPLGYGSGVRSADETESAAAAFTRMAVPAAAWLDHKLAELAGTHVGTTRDALSYAYFRAALHWERDGDRDWARLLYMSALHQDPDNVGALANLAVLELREGAGNRGITLLQRALGVIEGGAGDGDDGSLGDEATSEVGS